MREDEVSGKGAFFKKTLLLMSSFLILLFIAYELLESPSRDFVSMKIVSYKEGQQGVSITLSISNNSSSKSEGVLLVMLGYADSTVYENSTSYSFAGFEIVDHSVVQVLPREEKTVKIDLSPNAGAKRILALYCLNPGFLSEINDYDTIVVRRSEALWVQTWIKS